MPRRSLTDDGEPDEPTQIIYVNGIFTLEESPTDGVGSAASTTLLLLQTMEAWPRFGTGDDLRANVNVSYFYNRSELQAVRDYKAAHGCETKAARELRILQWLHALKRLAECKGVPFLIHVMDSDLLEAYEQINQLQGNGGALAADAYPLASRITAYHTANQHVILMGHSQGNLLIAQALQATTYNERKPLNIGNGCTAVMALASPLGQMSFWGSLEPSYVGGLIVHGDVLQQLHGSVLTNDFPQIATPAGDSVLLFDSRIAKLKQGVHAHFMTQNYLEYRPSVARLEAEMTLLSDRCSVGTFEITSNLAQMMVHDKAKIGINMRSRTGQPLYGRAFQGGTDIAYVSGEDSTVFATSISDVPTTVPVHLYNSAKVQASLTVNRVIKQPMILGMTYTLSEPDIYFSRFYTYTVTARRADSGPFSAIVVNPLEPFYLRDSWAFGSGTSTTLITGDFPEQYAEQGPGIRWEIKSYDGPLSLPTVSLIGVDTISASAGGGGGASPVRIPLSPSVTSPRSGSAAPGEIFKRRVYP